MNWFAKQIHPTERQFVVIYPTREECTLLHLLNTPNAPQGKGSINQHLANEKQ